MQLEHTKKIVTAGQTAMVVLLAGTLLHRDVHAHREHHGRPDSSSPAGGAVDGGGVARDAASGPTPGTRPRSAMVSGTPHADTGAESHARVARPAAEIAAHSDHHSASIGIDALVGRLHPLLVHFPIAWIFLLLLVDLVSFAFRRPGWRRAGELLLLATAVAAVPAVATGLFRHATHGPSDVDALILDHRNLMLGATVALLVALVIRTIERRRSFAGAQILYWVSLLAATGLLTVGAHLGGKVVYGPDYLPF